MTPEISHRCPSCGASIRDFGERAMFCPECGKPLATSDEEQSPDQVQATVPEQSVRNVDADTRSNPSEQKLAAGDQHQTDETTKSPRSERHGAREKTRETLHRASSVARGAIEDNVKRAERIHHVSTVMLEEASSDPSLRFVLVALGLFIVFVILLVISKVMG